MTPLSAPEVTFTLDLKDATKDEVKLNGIKQEGSSEDICGDYDFPVSIYYIEMGIFYFIYCLDIYSCGLFQKQRML